MIRWSLSSYFSSGMMPVRVLWLMGLLLVVTLMPTSAASESMSAPPTSLVANVNDDCTYDIRQGGDGLGGGFLRGAPLYWAVNGTWLSLECMNVTRSHGTDRQWMSTYHGWNMLVGIANRPLLSLQLRNHNMSSWVTMSYTVLDTPIFPGVSSLVGTFPAFLEPDNDYYDGRLSWYGSFVQPTFGACSTSLTGGPCVLYSNNSSKQRTLNGKSATVVVSALDNFVQTSRATHLHDGTTVAWAGGVSGWVNELPAGFKHEFIVAGSNDGITDAVHVWGKLLQMYHNTNRSADITIEKLGYQTDNGAQYCFGCGNNCTSVLLDELAQLKGNDVPVSYLSYQNAWWHTSRSAPWCVTDWDWVPERVPMGVPEFHKQAGVPFQLYAPYFCNNTPYAMSNFTFLSANTELSKCGAWDFMDVSPEDSYDFYMWFLQLGMSYGMVSYEMDFVNQNLNCVDRFLTEIGAAQGFLDGMAKAALELGLSMQWCYASPNALLRSLLYPAVTNFRASFDYAYGNSWDIGTSSLLMSALWIAPSTDTFWTSDNGELATKLGGCKKTGCPEDHNDDGSLLHTILAIMSTGPVGISDALGHTNAARIQATCRTDGTLLQPSKPMTTMDGHFQDDSFILQTYSGPPDDKSKLWAYYVLGHHLNSTDGTNESVHVSMDQFWPRPGSFAWPSSSSGNNKAADDNGPDWLVMWFKEGHNTACETDEGPLDACATRLINSSFTMPQTRSTFEAALATLVPLCPNGWAVLGQVQKYATLSHHRFVDVTCVDDGIRVEVVGSPGETGTLSFASPDGSVWVQDFSIPSTSSLLVLQVGTDKSLVA